MFKVQGSIIILLRSYVLTLFFLLLSCNNPSSTGVIQSGSKKTEKIAPLLLENRKFVELENEEIELFLKRYKWNMKQTDTGLRYEITKKGKGTHFKTGETVTLEYRTMLLSGEEIYNSNTDGVKNFVVERSEEIAGLHEVIKLMNPSTEARLIIPSHLAYGVTGDGNKVNPYQTIVMKIKVLN
jgi:FKBP-type peptidyl-prolyl cis-trans isomerase